jgi:protein-disulfide isomerase
MTSEPMPKKSRFVSIALRSALAVILFIIVVAIGFGAGIFVQSNPQWAVLSTAETEAQFEQRVADYLTRNPEVIADAFEAYAERQGGSASISHGQNGGTSQGRSGRLSRAERDRQLNEDPDSPVRGNANGDIALVEFFDYNCPYCRQILSTLADLQEANPRLRIVYKEFPVLNDNSRFAARAALASRRQDKYFEFHDALMGASGIITPETVIELARSVGIGIRRLRRDMSDPAVVAAIERNLALAESLRITGTPGFVVGDRVFRGAADRETLQALIDRAR